MILEMRVRVTEILFDAKEARGICLPCPDSEMCRLLLVCDLRADCSGCEMVHDRNLSALKGGVSVCHVLQITSSSWVLILNRPTEKTSPG